MVLLVLRYQAEQPVVLLVVLVEMVVVAVAVHKQAELVLRAQTEPDSPLVIDLQQL